jgi:hypothetical protein
MYDEIHYQQSHLDRIENILKRQFYEDYFQLDLNQFPL